MSPEDTECERERERLSTAFVARAASVPFEERSNWTVSRMTVERVRLGGGSFVSGRRIVGGLAGLLSDSTVKGVEAEATVMGTRTIGGVFGLLQDTTVSNTTAWADVSYVPPAVSSSQSGGTFGGLFGFAYGSTVISHSESHGVVFAVPEGEGLQGVGGFGGQLYQGATITHCVSTASATGGGLVGGLLGSLADADVEWSYATGDATGVWPETGTAAGFIGNVWQAMNSASIHVRNSYSTGTAVAATSAAGFVFTGVSPIDNPDGEPVVRPRL